MNYGKQCDLWDTRDSGEAEAVAGFGAKDLCACGEEKCALGVVGRAGEGAANRSE